MLEVLSNVARFVEPLGLTVLLVYCYGFFSRSAQSPNRTSIAMGTVFGLAAVISMASPITLSDGIIADLRNLFVGVSAAFFGWPAALVTGIIAAFARLSIGGSGTQIGILAILISAGAGLTWARFVRPKVTSVWVSLPLLGAFISTHLFAGLLFPSELAIKFFTQIAPVICVLNFAGVGIFAMLIDRERALMGETNRLLLAATTDPLTRALNRRSVIDRYNCLIQLNAPRRGVAMVCIDVDNFKMANDTFGHLAGDKVLVEIAARIRSCLRSDDLFARMSGDEFLIVLTNVASQEAQSITERCRKIISRAPVPFEGETINTSISVGTVWSPRMEEFAEFRDAADAALYQAKSAGRDCMAFNGKHDFNFDFASDAA